MDSEMCAEGHPVCSLVYKMVREEISLLVQKRDWERIAEVLHSYGEWMEKKACYQQQAA